MTKRIAIVTKAQADKVLVNSLFQPVNGRTLNTMKWDNGKYKADVSFIGREVEVPETVFAIYPVKRQDADGKYTQLMCVTA